MKNITIISSIIIEIAVRGQYYRNIHKAIFLIFIFSGVLALFSDCRNNNSSFSGKSNKTVEGKAIQNSVNEYRGRYLFSNNVDTKGEIIIMYNGTFTGQLTDIYDNVLDNLSGRLEGNKLLFDGNNSNIMMTGTISGDMINCNLWTSITGDVYFPFYKADSYD